MTRALVRLSASDRLTLAFFGVVVGGAAAWFAWWLVGGGEVLVGVSVAGFVVLGVLALWWGIRGRYGLP